MASGTSSTPKCTLASPRQRTPLPSALLTALLATLLSLCANLALADPHRDRPGQRPMREAIGEVEQNYRGHVVDVQSLRRDSNEDVYRMRVLQRDGRVKTVTVPAGEQQQRQQQRQQQYQQQERQRR